MLALLSLLRWGKSMRVVVSQSFVQLYPSFEVLRNATFYHLVRISSPGGPEEAMVDMSKHESDSLFVQQTGECTYLDTVLVFSITCIVAKLNSPPWFCPH